MTPSQILRAAKALIESPAHWWNGRGDRRCYMNSAGLICRQVCAIQAISFALDFDGDYGGSHRFLGEAIGRQGVYMSIVTFNDSHTHAEVMAMFDRAIELAEAAEMYAELGAEPVEEAVAV